MFLVGQRDNIFEITDIHEPILISWPNGRGGSSPGLAIPSAQLRFRPN
jgi:hypothetical protein